MHYNQSLSDQSSNTIRTTGCEVRGKHIGILKVNIGIFRPSASCCAEKYYNLNIFASVNFNLKLIIDMEIKEYKAPRAKVIEIMVQNVLCQSGGTRYSEEELDPEIFG